jgi:glycine reductase
MWTSYELVLGRRGVWKEKAVAPAKQLRVVHYINQYFAGVGGEEKASIGPESREGPVGPGIGLQAAFGDAATVVGTVFCGDNYLTGENDGAALGEVVELIRSFSPDVVVAGPSFGSGRYGLACGLVCQQVQEQLGIPAVAGMHEDSPGAEQYRKLVTIVPTRETAVGMGAALSELARLASKVGRGETLGAPDEDGYLARGYRQNEFSNERSAARAVTLLLKKLKGESYRTEWPLPHYDRVAPPAPLAKRESIRVALVAEGGVVPKGNPDKIPSAWATTWAKYDLKGLSDLTGGSFETVHGGFDTTAANQDPDRLLPLDVLRDLEHTGKVEVYGYMYSTVGNMGSITVMRRLGEEIAKELKEARVDAVLVGST